MKQLKPFLSFIILVTFVFFYSCNKTEEFKTDALEDVYPIAIGKSITYRLDSTVFTVFGTVTKVNSYQEKHTIDSKFTDLQGRTAYRVYVAQRDSAGLGPWNETRTYSITPLADQIEVSDDNLRYIKLHLPFKDGFTWKGNKYFPPNPYSSEYNFSNDDNLGEWEYYYDGELSSFSYKGKNYTDVYTVEQADESYNVPIVDTRAYAAKSRGIEKYSKNIGLVYKEYELWEYQPNPGGASPYKTGFGVKMWMIAHN